MTITRRQQRQAALRRTWWTVLASLILHLTAILAVAWFYVVEFESPPEPVEEIEITLIEAPASAPKPVFVDSTAPEAPVPQQAAFESDRNTAAASAEQAQGDAPVPTQEGRDQPFLELEERQLALAQPAPVPPAPEVPPSQPSPPVPPEPPQPEQAKPKEEISPKPDEVGLLAKAEPLREPKKQKDRPPPPAPPPSRPAFQRQARATRLRGSIDSAGRSSVASLSTPLGRYRKAISDAVGSSWYYYIGSRLDMFSYGTVTVLFNIDKTGKARRPRVLSNTSNESFEIVTVESILAAEIPPIPPDVLPALEGGQIEIDFSFSIITN